MKELKNSLEIWCKSTAAIGLRSRLLAFLCARFGTLSNKRRILRAIFFQSIGCFAKNGQIAVTFGVSGTALAILLRKANIADYLVFGELVLGGYKIPSNVSRPHSVVDGGANIGLFTLFASALFPDIELTCYEPDKENLTQLRMNLEANKIKADIIPNALWSDTAELFFHPGESYNGFVNAIPSLYPVSCTLPVVFDDCWLKLDIEGAEYEVLPALLKAGASPSLISVEIHDFNRRGEHLLSLLKSAGYFWRESFQPTEQCVAITAIRSNS